MTSNQASAWLLAELRLALPGVGDRIFPDAAPEGTGNPCAIYQAIDGENDSRLDAGEETKGFIAYQVRLYATTRKAANYLRQSLRTALTNREPADLPGWRLTGTAYANGEDTFDPKLKEYGATCLVEVHGE